MSPNVPFPTGMSGATCVVSSGQEKGDVCQVPSAPSKVGGHRYVSTLLPCLAVGVEMGHSWPLLGFPCGVSLPGTEAGPPWGWRLVFAALSCLLLSHPGHSPEGTE